LAFPSSSDLLTARPLSPSSDIYTIILKCCLIRRSDSTISIRTGIIGRYSRYAVDFENSRNIFIEVAIPKIKFFPSVKLAPFQRVDSQDESTRLLSVSCETSSRLALETLSSLRRGCFINKSPLCCRDLAEKSFRIISSKSLSYQSLSFSMLE